MKSHFIRLNWFLCLVFLLTACAGQPATTNPAATTSTVQAVNSPNAAPSDTPTPSPTRTRVLTYTAMPTRMPPTKTPKTPMPPVTRTYQPIQTATPAVEQPYGEIAYFDAETNSEWHTINLKDLNSGQSSLVYQSFHDKKPDPKQGLSWTSDGKKIAFGSQDSTYTTPSDIFLLTIGADEAVNLTKTDSYRETEPAISPKGKLIAFISDRRKGEEYPRDIYTMQLDGNQVKLLLECQETCSYPAWSPDAKQLAFRMGDDLYVLPVGGGKPKLLVTGGINRFPAWSPDGQWIAFFRSQSLDYGSPSYIYLVKPDGSGLYALTGELSQASFLSWSPDSKFIAFHCSIFHIASETGLGWRKICMGDTDYSPAWRPFDLSKLPTPTSTTVADLFDCSNGWTRLIAGGQAQVIGDPGDAPNRVRAEPNLNATQVGLLEPGTVFTLLRGPICTDGLVWWKISEASLPGGVGYTAEGDGEEYWLQPYE